MPYATTIRALGLEEFEHAVDPELLLAEVEKTIGEAALYAEARVRTRSFATHDTAATSRSWMAESHGMSATVSSPLVSAVIEEEGRRPGAKMPPPQSLAGWARRHGFPVTSGALFALARAIARRGRPGRFYLREATRDLEQRLPTMLTDTAARIVAVYERRASR